MWVSKPDDFMKLSIFKKANKLIELVNIDGEIRDRIYLSIQHFKTCEECFGEGKIEEESNDEECIVCDGTGKVNDSVKVCLVNDGKKTYIASCTCTHHSIYQGTAEKLENKLMLCSYILACLIYLIQNDNTKIR